MAAARKFTFETVFSPEGEIVRDGDGFRTQFTAEEMASARAEAYAQGQQESEHAARMALQALNASMTALHGRLEAECRALREEAAELALAAARKAADAALDAYGEARVLAALGEVMAQLRGAPRLVVRLAPALAETLQPRLEAIKAEHFHEGALILRAEPAVPVGDVAIEWAEGAIAHDRAAVFANIETMMRRALDAAAEEEQS
ncbi:MAG: FliH/SctL family protein [Hyphomonadaceae bacterium]